ncbi:MAG: CPBP family intramembrane metalloprotease [Deltaproteobacteria bacterium]|nr:CPBP family intramembrane metalloprotease [Candidatus Zymogenaceae bacterium]
MPPMTDSETTTETHSGRETAIGLAAFICAAAAGLLLPTQGLMSTISLVLLFLSGWMILQLDMPAPATYVLFFILAHLTRILPFYSLGLMLFFPLLVFITICLVFEPLRSGSLWLRRGRITPRGIAVGGVIIAVSCVSLVLWYRLCNPDISEFTAFLPPSSGIALLATGLAFSLVNALTEECIYRGILWEGLHAVTHRWQTALIVQALIFGVAHWWGVPNGIVGIILGIVYGLMMGFVRYVAGGLLLPIAVHIFADLVVFALLLDTAGRLG